MNQRFIVRAAAVLGFGAVYFLAADVGLRLKPVSGFASLVWAPTGIALAALLLGGRWLWPGVALGAWCVNTSHGAGALTACGIAAGNTLEAVAGAWLLRRVGFRSSIERLRDCAALVVLGAGLSTLISATLGVGSLSVAGVVPWAEAHITWLAWWMGDMLGELIVAPLLLVWSTSPRIGRPRRAFEAVLLAGSAVATSLIVFEVWRIEWLTHISKPYLLFPIVLWASLRFGQHGGVVASALISALAVGGTLRGAGLFAEWDLVVGLFHLHTLLAVLAITSLAVAAVDTERRRGREELKKSHDELEAQVAERTRQLVLANERVLTREAQLREAQRIARIGSWEWDIRADCVTWSDEMHRIYGLEREQFAASYQAFLARVHPDDRDLAERVVRRAFEDHGDFDFEHRIVRPDGTVYTLHGRGRVLLGDDGAPVRMIGTGQDITERKQVEEALRRAYGEMELRVHERTADLERLNESLRRENAERSRLEGALRQKLEELAQADRRKDEFLATLAHELRNPLAPISYALELVRRTEYDGPTVRQTHGMMERQVHQLVRLIDDLMDASRVTSGKLTLQKETIALAEVVRSAVELARPHAEEAGHQISVSLPAEPILLNADPVRIAQIFSNLLDNAIKYTKRGGRIQLTAERRENDLVVSVRDTGIGIPAAMLPRVFEMFAQVDRSLERTSGGLGIGLTLVKRLAELHGGGVEARSEGPGKGSEFIVRLPALSPASAARTEERIDADERSSHRGCYRVLVVDDNEDAARGLSVLLRSLGHEVCTGHDGLQAVELSKTFRPDVALLDIGMPILNGHDAARRIRSEAEGAEMLLIALSGWGQEADQRLSKEAGFDHHLVKPVDFAELERQLARLMASRSPGQAP